MLPNPAYPSYVSKTNRPAHINGRPLALMLLRHGLSRGPAPRGRLFINHAP